MKASYIPKLDDAHVHTLKKAFKMDKSKDPEDMNPKYRGESRWLLMRVCTTCPYRYAYDITYVSPRVINEKANKV